MQFFYIMRHGIPTKIHFDHDLAEEHNVVGSGDKTGYDFTLWLVDYMLENDFPFPVDFEFSVHSTNPVGKEKICGLMENFIKHMEMDK